jgi:hypothetical protein
MPILSVPEALPYIACIHYTKKNYEEDLDVLEGFGYAFGVFRTARYDLYHERKGSYKTVSAIDSLSL